MTKLIRTYGSCAILAREGEHVVGTLRFYPKAVLDMPEAGKMCMQQFHPAGASPELVDRDFPPLDQINDKTLMAYCLFVSASHQRQGLASRLAKTLVRWARERGWRAIEANAYEDIPIYYRVTGVAGKAFWHKLGFRLAAQNVEPEIHKHADFLATARREAAELGMDSKDVANRYTMRLTL
jgi:GNAT superfamily N-acetyltransferase